jgi:hypothetical protein
MPLDISLNTITKKSSIIYNSILIKKVSIDRLDFFLSPKIYYTIFKFLYIK